MPYLFGLLDPRPAAPEAVKSNDRLLSGPAMGIEVTVPALAGRCHFGNIDPQHTGGDASTAAIEVALRCPLPPAAARLLTIRPDADALGSMAVLWLRKEAEEGYGDEFMDTVYTLSNWRQVRGGIGLLDRVMLIASTDKEKGGPWPGPRAIDEAADLLGSLAALGAMCADHTLPLDRRVLLMRDWLLCGEFQGQDDYQARTLAEADAALADLEVTVRGCVAIVTGSHRLAMSIGYRLCPVVVATDPVFRFAGGAPHRKHTVARWNSATKPGMRWAAMVEQLNTLDAAARVGPEVLQEYNEVIVRWANRLVGSTVSLVHMSCELEEAPMPPSPPMPSQWGGSFSIVGSPMGVGSGLSTDDVARAVGVALGDR